MTSPEAHTALVQEREEIRQTILSSLRLIVQSQYVLADLQENQKRLERLLSQLDATVTPKETGSGDAPEENAT